MTLHYFDILYSMRSKFKFQKKGAKWYTRFWAKTALHNFHL